MPGVWSQPDPNENSWGPAEAALPVSNLHHAEADPAHKQSSDSITIAVCTALIALLGLPFLLGSWCWPVLVSRFTGIVVSQTTKLLSYTLQFALFLAMFTNITQHTVYLCRVKPGQQVSHRERFGPAYAVATATVLFMTLPTFVVMRIGNHIDPMHTFYGHLMHACTVVGFVMLFVGTLWASGVTEKWGRGGVHEL